MMTELPHATLVRLTAQAEAISLQLEGLSEAQIKARVLADKWSIQETLAHIGRYQEIFVERVHAMVTEDDMTFAPYNADEDILHEAWASLSVNDLLTNFYTGRKRLTRLLRSLSPAELQRTGRHGKFGEMDIGAWTEFFLLHEAHHLFGAFKLAAAHRNQMIHA